jgi:hypothetical protein
MDVYISNWMANVRVLVFELELKRTGVKVSIMKVIVVSLPLTNRPQCVRQKHTDPLLINGWHVRKPATNALTF